MTDFDAMNQVVGNVNGKPVTRGELMKYFDMVADKANWKNPINARVKLAANEVAMLTEAVIFFTGSVPTILPMARKGEYKVKANGYYLTIGA